MSSHPRGRKRAGSVDETAGGNGEVPSRTRRPRLEEDTDERVDEMELDAPGAQAVEASADPCGMQEGREAGVVFISYANDDSANVFKLVLSTLQARGLDVFDPIKLVHPGIPEMESRVAASDLMIAVLSPQYFESEYCCAEAAAAVRAGVTIIPVYDGDKWHHRAEESEVLAWRDVETLHSTAALRNHVYSGNLVRVIDTQNQGVAVNDLFLAISLRCPSDLFSIKMNTIAPCHEDDAVIDEDVWGNHPVPTPYFCGRQSELEQLQITLDEGHAAAIAALGGCGKSQLMLQFALRSASVGAYRSGVFWVTADTTEIFEQELTELIEELGDPSGNQCDDIQKCIRTAAKLLNRRPDRWLLCVDNADGPDVLKLLQVLWPNASKGRGAELGHLLVTSRCRKSLFWENLGLTTALFGGQASQLLVLQPLDTHDAESVLLRRRYILRSNASVDVEACRQSLDADEIEALSDIAGTKHDYSLGGLPLALQQAGAYMFTHEISFREYLRQYLILFREGSTEAALEDIPAGEAAACGRRAIHTTWALNISTLSPTARGVLDAAAFYAPDAIPNRLLLALTVTVSTRADHIGYADVAMVFDAHVKDELGRRSSLLTFGDGTSSMHRMLRGFLQSAHNTGETPERRHTSISDTLCALEAVAGSVPQDDYKTPKIMTVAEIVPHVNSVLGNDLSTYQDPERIAFLQNFVANFWQHRSLYPQALLSATASLQTRVKMYGDYHSKVASSANLVGSICSDLGDWDSAVLHYQRAIDIYRHTTAKSHASLITANSLDGMNQQIHGADTDHSALATSLSNLATSLSNIGIVMKSKGDFDEALRYYQQSLEMKRRIHGAAAGGSVSTLTACCGRVLHQQ